MRVGRAALPLMSAPRIQRPLNNATTRLKGSEFLSTVSVKAKADISSPSDRILATFPITPSGYPGTRITGLADFWERYRFESFAARYVPAVPNTLGCQFVVYLDTDPNDDPTTISDADALIRQAVAQTGAQQWNFNTSRTIPLASRRDDQFYYTGNDKQNLRFSRQGTGYLIQVTDPVSYDGSDVTSSLVAGTLYIDWECTFQTPQIEPEAVVAKSGGPTAPTELEEFLVDPQDEVTVLKTCDVSAIYSFEVDSDATAATTTYLGTVSADLFGDPVEVTFGTTPGYDAAKSVTSTIIDVGPVALQRTSFGVTEGVYTPSTTIEDVTGWVFTFVGVILVAPAGCITVAPARDQVDTIGKGLRDGLRHLLSSGTGRGESRSTAKCSASVRWPACHTHLTSRINTHTTTSTRNERDEIISAVSALKVT
jgi:hypothetical protein